MTESDVETKFAPVFALKASSKSLPPDAKPLKSYEAIHDKSRAHRAIMPCRILGLSRSTQVYDPIFLPSRSRAERGYSNKSQGRLSGEGPVTTASYPRPFVLGFESGLERQVRAMFLARPDVIDIVDQPFEVHAVDADGKPQKIIPDYVVRYEDGSSSAVEVKPMDRVKSLNFEQKLEFFSEFLRPDQADEVVLVTDESFERWEAINAERLLEMRRDPDDEADDLIQELAGQLTSPTTVEGLIEEAKLGGRAFPAIFRAIYSGVLRQIEDGTINLTTIVENGAVQ